jgi:hypothetical protein
MDFTLAIYTVGVISTYINVEVVIINYINGANGANSTIGVNR